MQPCAHFFDQGSQPRFERAAAGAAHFERQSETGGDGCGLRAEFGVVELGEIDHALVIAEVVGGELGMAVQAEAFPDQAVEAAQKEIREEKRAGFVAHERVELRAGVHLVAVRAGDAGHAEAGQHFVQLTAGAAVAVDNSDAFVAREQFTQLRLNQRRNAGWRHVFARGNGVAIDLPAVHAREPQHLARKGAA